MKLGDGKPKPHGTWDWFGSCDPQHHKGAFAYETFSVGVFQWVRKSKGRGTRKGAIIGRIVGSTANPESTYARANAECDAHTKGGSKGDK